MTFRVGQKVVCVDDVPRKYPKCNVTKGHIYTVSALSRGGACVFLIEVKGFGSVGDYFADRFRPIVERKTDISIFTKMLKPQGVDA